MFGFVKKLAGVKAEDAGQTIVEKLVEMDPTAATEAQLRVMEEDIDKLTSEVAKARTEYNQEQKDVDEIITLESQRMKAAEILQAKLEEDPENADLISGLNDTLDLLEKMQPEIQREKDEAIEAKSFLDEIEGLLQERVAQVKDAKATLKSAARDMEKAKVAKARETDRAKRMGSISGMRDKSSSLTIAVDAMKKRAEKDKAATDASKMKRELLSGSTEKKNSAVEAAMAEASGTTSPSSMTAAERLAALKKKK